MAPIVNGLSIDVEEYFQVEAAADVIPRDAWDTWPSRVEPAVDRVLTVLDEADCTATFFVLGWVAERRPGVVRAIAEAGHEVACHGYAHQHIKRLTPDAFREDVHRAKGLLEGLAGAAVQGYRAPTFSIVNETMWALDVLIDEGLTYDSSIFPVHHDRYGVPDAPRMPHLIERPDGRIVELPPLTARVRGVNLPLAGGGYMRLFPLWAVKWAVRRMNREGGPAVIYLHPWETDPGQPRMPLRWPNTFRHRVGLRRMASKLRRLVRSAPFGPLGALAGAVYDDPTDRPAPGLALTSGAAK